MSEFDDENLLDLVIVDSVDGEHGVCPSFLVFLHGFAQVKLQCQRVHPGTFFS